MKSFSQYVNSFRGWNIEIIAPACGTRGHKARLRVRQDYIVETISRRTHNGGYVLTESRYYRWPVTHWGQYCYQLSQKAGERTKPFWEYMAARPLGR